MLTEQQLRRARRTLEKEQKSLLARVKSTNAGRKNVDERDTDEADIIVNLQTRAQELWAKDELHLRLYEVTHALRRMDQGLYGQCESCGAEIDPDRLSILPETTLCVQCRAKVERSMRFAAAGRDLDVEFGEESNEGEDEEEFEPEEDEDDN